MIIIVNDRDTSPCEPDESNNVMLLSCQDPLLVPTYKNLPKLSWVSFLSVYYSHLIFFLVLVDISVNWHLSLCVLSLSALRLVKRVQSWLRMKFSMSFFESHFLYLTCRQIERSSKPSSLSRVAIMSTQQESIRLYFLSKVLVSASMTRSLWLSVSWLVRSRRVSLWILARLAPGTHLIQSTKSALPRLTKIGAVTSLFGAYYSTFV